MGFVPCPAQSLPLTQLLSIKTDLFPETQLQVPSGRGRCALKLTLRLPGGHSSHPAPWPLSGSLSVIAELNKPVSNMASVTLSAGPWNSRFCPETTNCPHEVLAVSRGCGVAQPGRDAAVHEPCERWDPRAEACASVSPVHLPCSTGRGQATGGICPSWPIAVGPFSNAPQSH